MANFIDLLRNRRSVRDYEEKEVPSEMVQEIIKESCLAPSSGNFMFAASDKGLGTCWIGLGTHIKSPGLLKSMAMPQDYKIAAPIIVGYPKSIPEIPARSEPQIFKIIR